MEARKLPTYWGVTIDKRLKQFRYIRPNGMIEFIDFNSDRGDRLLTRAIHEAFFADEELGELI